MNTINKEQLNIILENHKHWLNKDCADWENMKANLSDFDLRGADFRGSNLSCVDLSYADISFAKLNGVDLHNAYLRGADLHGADLHGANMDSTNICGANLYGADLRYTNLYSANLYGADLRYTNLYSANLCGADLRYTNLYSANMRYANLNNIKIRDANLNNADISGAYLNNADISGAYNVPYISMICPEEGAFIGWKKARIADKSVIVKLSIPASAKRSSATSRKCRCNKAKVLEMYNLDGTVAEERKCYSTFDKNFIYEVGKMVKVNDFDDDRWNECSHGIHFFINRQEAINYVKR